ncbi:helix-turn-helix domain-containing protein, partial [Collinsella intestinalis]|uniref:helix-turn-helix domain-containing protein n=1 Tax=Collinsella intestinalis TaxID=147207 RepID=UPI001959696C
MDQDTADRRDPVTIPRQAGIYVRRAREAQGLTRRQLAEAARVSERLLAALELGDAPGIGLDKLLAVLDALGLSLEVRGCPKASNPWDVPAKPRRAAAAPPRTAPP